MDDEALAAARTTQLLTILVGLMLLASSFVPRANAHHAAAACDPDGGDQLAPPRFVATTPSQPDDPSQVVSFRVAPYVGATEFDWQATEDGVVLDESDRSAPPSDPGELITDLIATSAIVSNIQTGFASEEASEVVDELAGLDYQIVPSAHPGAEWPGDLTVEVRARVCDNWTPPARTVVRVD